MKLAIGLFLAFAIGIGCRLGGVPLPAPPVLIGALLVLAMSAGYALVEHVARHRPARHRADCGGPSGRTARTPGGAS